jgi:transposase
MPQSLFFDLRSRVLAAIDQGLSHRQAAKRFGVSASSALAVKITASASARPEAKCGAAGEPAPRRCAG